MRSIGTVNHLAIPAVWRELLAGMLKQDAPACPLNGTDIHDPRAYKDDNRSVSITMEEFEVFANLKSSDEKYWLEWEIWEGHLLIFSNDADPDYEIPNDVSIFVPEHELVFQFLVEFTEKA